MTGVKPSIRHFNACIRCVRQTPTGYNTLGGGATRLLSTTAPAREELQTETATPAPPPPPPASAPTDAKAKEDNEWMKQWGELDPNRVEDKRTERRLIRREGIQPIGSRRRRAVIRRSSMRNVAEVPFEQLPYQCFQEARKVLLEDRQEKLKQIETQTLRLKNLMAQDPAVSGGEEAKESRIRSMRNYINELIILADINDPVVKKNFEDGLADMNKPIYRHLAQKKWEKHKKLILDQRLNQMNVIPDILPVLDSKLDIDLGFGRKNFEPGDFVDSAISEQMPRLKVQSFESGEKLVSVVVVDPDVPAPDTDGFTYRCHFIASNIPISPTKTSIPLIQIGHQDAKATDPAEKKIALPWIAPWAVRGGPYHRLAVFILEQADSKALNVTEIAKKIKRSDFIMRSFVDKYKLKPLGATLFRTKWDESTAGVMERAGHKHLAEMELKRKRVEPLPYKRRTERMR